MFYAKVEDGVITAYPLATTDILRANPNVSFPQGPLTTEMLAEFGYQPVHASARPVLTAGQQAERGLPVLSAGVWVEQWTARDATVEETTNEAHSMRFTRNQLLAACDWTQVADAPVNVAVWAAYRQALRDLTSQPGFPWTTDWPVVPVL